MRIRLSTHPEKRALSPLIGFETGSVRMAKQIMPSKGVPFSIEDWPSVILEGLRVANENNWFPVMTLMVGNPGETDEDSRATLDLLYEIERRGLFAILVPSIFTPLHDTRMEKQARRYRDAAAYALAVADHHEVLEDGFGPDLQYLVGAPGVEIRLAHRLAAQAAAHEWPELQMAAHHVLGRDPGEDPGAHGEDLPRPAAQNQDAARTDRLTQAPLLAIPAPG